MITYGKTEAPDQIKRIFNRHEKLLELLAKHNGWICGGAIRSALCGEKLKDIDLFFASSGDARRFYGAIEIDCKTVFKNERHAVVKHKFGQLDICFADETPTPKDSIDYFDFTICCCAIDKDNFYCHDNFFLDLASKRLVVNGVLPFPASTLSRMQKYIQRGYIICNGGIRDIILGIYSMTEDQMKAIDFTPVSGFLGVD